ncbi:MAG: type II toxin-antitoxin system RelE/ParE family toxin [Deltaproteobacteria bacterium]|nr:type II toxin-antitoxin system RelE/ParE family toxin [Deltaproteobacteria bacterium]
MEKYKVVISSSAEKSLKKIPKKDVQYIIVAMERLAVHPFPVGARKLSGYEKIFRIRIGKYRVIYEVEGQELLILVLKIGHRKDIYR